MDRRIPAPRVGQGGRVLPPTSLSAPIDRETHVVLRAAVLLLVEAAPARDFAPELHCGLPGRCVRRPDLPRTADAGLHADVAVALLRRGLALGPRPRLWLTRPGALSPHDDDLRWLGPTSWAASALGVHVGLVVVTRRGWFDPVSGVSREWRRLRRR